MSTIDIDEYINRRLDDQIMFFERVAFKSKQYYRRIEWITIIFASLTPIFVMLNFLFAKDHWVQWIPVVSSTIVAILTGGLKTFRYDELWKKYRQKEEDLKKEKFQFLTRSGVYASAEDEAKVFIDTIETIIHKD
jgi:hypothetical protein